MALEQTHPRFRTDLVAQPLEVDGNRFIDVTDPDTEETFRFYEVEYSVACAMDGRRDVPGLIRWAKDELGLEPESSEVELVITTLADLGYLSGNDVELGAAGPADLASPPLGVPDTSDVELGAPGGTPSSRAPAVVAPSDLELGNAGKSSATPPPMPPSGGSVTMGWDVPDVSALIGDGTLGPSGVSAPREPAPDMPPPPPDPPAEPTATLKPSGDAASDEDGPTHIPAPATDDENEDVSVDLSDHLSIGTSDVQEAVRQSKVMQAVEVPDDLAAAIDEDAAPAKVDDMSASEIAVEKEVPKPAPEPPKPAPVPTNGAAAAPAPPKPEPKPAPKPAEQAAKPPVEAPKAEKKSSSVGLLILILLLAAGGGGAYWYFKIYKADDAAAPAPKRQTKAAPGKNQQGNKPAEPATPKPAPVLLEDAEPIEAPVEAVADGKIEWIADPGTQVDEGDVVAKFKGVSSVERSLARPRRKLEEYSAKLEEAKAAGNEKGIERYTAKVEEKAGLVAAGEEKLALLTMTAPQAGTLDVVSSVGATVAKGDTVAKVTGESGLKAELDAKGQTFEVGADCEIASVKKPATPVECKVIGFADGKVTVRIAKDVGLAAGEAVRFPAK